MFTNEQLQNEIRQCLKVAHLNRAIFTALFNYTAGIVRGHGRIWGGKRSGRMAQIIPPLYADCR